MYHFAEEPGRVCSSTEAKDVDVVAGLIVSHDEFVAGQDVVNEADTEHLIEGGKNGTSSLGEELDTAGVVVGSL